MKVFSQTKRG